MRTILAEGIVTITIVNSVACDTISLSEVEATGRNYVQVLPVALSFSAYSESPGRSGARALCSVTRAVSCFSRIGQSRRILSRSPGYAPSSAHPPTRQVAWRHQSQVIIATSAVHSSSFSQQQLTGYCTVQWPPASSPRPPR